MAFIPVYILILAITIIIDYFAGIWIEDSKGETRKIFLIISILSTCLVLFIFKYYNFFCLNIDSLGFDNKQPEQLCCIFIWNVAKYFLWKLMC